MRTAPTVEERALKLDMVGAYQAKGLETGFTLDTWGYSSVG